jgi:predicted DNA-binding protein (MmcQ/YjbR family)
MSAAIDIKTLRDYCLRKPGAVEEFPFDNETLVCKVKDKMFALIPLNRHDEPPQISLKCDPVLANMLRDIYDAVKPGYHLNKKHWNTITVDGSIPDDEVFEMIDQSYILVVKSLKKSDREQIDKLRRKLAK